jgi:anti-anti-sigma factor
MRSSQRTTSEDAAEPSRPVPAQVLLLAERTSTQIVLIGEIDIACQPELDAALSHVQTGRARPVTVNMAQLTFLSARGLGFLAQLHDTVHPAGYTVRLIAPSRQVQRVLALAGMAECFSLMQGHQRPPWRRAIRSLRRRGAVTLGHDEPDIRGADQGAPSAAGTAIGGRLLGVLQIVLVPGPVLLLLLSAIKVWRHRDAPGIHASEGARPRPTR